jgi:hypothetical protein
MATPEKKTTIQITTATRKRLYMICKKGQTYDAKIIELIDKQELQLPEKK